MMKKVLIGCGIVTLVVMLICGAGIGFVSCKAYQLSAGLEQGLSALRQLDRDHPFNEPPAGTRLADNPQRFDDFLAARRDVGSRINQMPLLGKLITASAEDAAAPDVGLTEVFRMMGDLPDALKDIARSLDQRQMSTAEYGWYITGVLAAVREAAAQGDTELGNLWAELESWASEAEMQIRAQQQQQGVDFRPEEAWDRVESRTSSLADLNLIRERSSELLRNPGLLLAELYLTHVAQTQ